jgi:hypothetical protein
MAKPTIPLSSDAAANDLGDVSQFASKANERSQANPNATAMSAPKVSRKSDRALALMICSSVFISAMFR